jgi:hypothetical protein
MCLYHVSKFHDIDSFSHTHTQQTTTDLIFFSLCGHFLFLKLTGASGFEDSVLVCAREATLYPKVELKDARHGRDVRDSKEVVVVVGAQRAAATRAALCSPIAKGNSRGSQRGSR